MERFRIEEVYGMHNYPGLPVGQFAFRAGPLMAAADRIIIEIEGRRRTCRAAASSIDTVLVGAQIINQIADRSCPQHRSARSGRDLDLPCFRPARPTT